MGSTLIEFKINRFRGWFGAFLLLALSTHISGCGMQGASDSTTTKIKKPVAGTPSPVVAKAPVFQPTDTWAVVGKFCGSLRLPVTLQEIYRLDASHLTRVDVSSSTPTSFCQIAYQYNRVVSQATAKKNVYFEVLTLQSVNARSVCWPVSDGQVGNTPSSDQTGPFGPETLIAKLVVRGKSIRLLEKGSTECPTALLAVDMTLK